MKVFTKDEATTVRRSKLGPLDWGELASTMTSNCADVIGQIFGTPLWGLKDRATGWPIELAIAINFLETLYKAGYAVVKLDGEEDAVGDLTRAELLAKLQAERQDRLALAVSVRHLAEQMDGSGVKFELLELTEPQEARP